MNISALDIEKVVKKVIEGIDMQEEKNCVDCVIHYRLGGKSYEYKCSRHRKSCEKSHRRN